MGLINRLTTKTDNDLINEGDRQSLCGTVLTGTTTIYDPGVPDPNTLIGQTAIVTGFNLSTDSVTPILVQLYFNTPANPNAFPPIPAPVQTLIYKGYIGGTAGSVDHPFAFGDWRYSNIGDQIVLDAAGGCAYTVYARMKYEQMPSGIPPHPPGTW